MDSFYITSTNPKQSNDNFIALINCCLKYKYDFNGLFGDYGTLNLSYPTVIVNQKETPHVNELNETVFPNINFHIFEDKSIYRRDEYYPIIVNDNEYYPILGVDCREPLYSLEFILHFLKENPDTYIANVNLNILNLQQLEQLFYKKDYSWEYIGELPEPRL